MVAANGKTDMMESEQKKNKNVAVTLVKVNCRLRTLHFCMCLTVFPDCERVFVKSAILWSRISSESFCKRLPASNLAPAPVGLLPPPQSLVRTQRVSCA